MSSGITSSKNSLNLLAVVGDFPLVEIANLYIPFGYVPQIIITSGVVSAILQIKYRFS
jgi:hypothetical protein